MLLNNIVWFLLWYVCFSDRKWVHITLHVRSSCIINLFHICTSITSLRRLTCDIQNFLYRYHFVYSIRYLVKGHYVSMKDEQFNVQSTESARSNISKNHTILFNNIVTSFQLLLQIYNARRTNMQRNMNPLSIRKTNISLLSHWS
jgi:hypothetical protein